MGSASELLKEKIRNLEGMMMGCQQEMVTLESSIEQEEQALELKRNGMYSVGLAWQGHLADFKFAFKNSTVFF